MGLKLTEGDEFPRPTYLRIREEFWIEEAGLVDFVDIVAHWTAGHKEAVALAGKEGKREREGGE